MHGGTAAGRLEPTMTSIIEGPITAADRAYAFAEIRSVCREVRSVVQCVRIHLTMQRHTTGDTRAAADCSILVDGATIICAGAAARTTRDAVDGLTARLRYRVQALDGPSARGDRDPGSALSRCGRGVRGGGDRSVVGAEPVPTDLGASHESV
jgi:hypothetical protein